MSTPTLTLVSRPARQDTPPFHPVVSGFARAALAEGLSPEAIGDEPLLAEHAAAMRWWRGDCPASSSGGHYFVKQGGQWVCSMCGQQQ